MIRFGAWEGNVKEGFNTILYQHPDRGNMVIQMLCRAGRPVSGTLSGPDGLKHLLARTRGAPGDHMGPMPPPKPKKKIPQFIPKNPPQRNGATTTVTTSADGPHAHETCLYQTSIVNGVATTIFLGCFIDETGQTGPATGDTR